MKICLAFGLIIALPALVYNVVDFIRPAFKREIKKSTVRYVSFLSLLLALAGGVFAFLLVVPASLHFFQNFSDGVSALINANDYLSFVINCVISFMVIFQAPLIVLFIDHIKPLTPGKLMHYQKHVIVGSLAAALILPFTYDPMTQFLIAIPIVILYNLAIVFVLFTHTKRKRASKKSAAKMPSVAAHTKTAAHHGQTAKPAPKLQPQLSAALPKQPVRQIQPATRQRHMDIIPRARLSNPTYSRTIVPADN